MHAATRHRTSPLPHFAPLFLALKLMWEVMCHVDAIMHCDVPQCDKFIRVSNRVQGNFRPLGATENENCRWLMGCIRAS